MNFVNALEKIPGIIAQYEERTAKLKADVPQLEAIISKSWGKEDELKQLKSDLAALDRKITTALAPTHEVPDDRMGVNKEEQDGEEVKRDDPSLQVEAPAQSTGSKGRWLRASISLPIPASEYSTGISTDRIIIQDRQSRHLSRGCLSVLYGYE